jgi:hypothetical protein
MTHEEKKAFQIYCWVSYIFYGFVVTSYLKTIGLSIRLYLLLLLLLQQFCVAYVPPKLPLSPFPSVTGDQLQEYAEDVLQVLGEATLPATPSELLAIFFSEAAAGFVGGLSEKITAGLIGDNDRFESSIKGSTTSAYFGVRSAVRSISKVLGISTPVSQVLASVIASVFAESLKIASQEMNEKEKSGMNINFAEIFQDVIKWVAYDILLPTEDDVPVPMLIAAENGAISGLLSHLIVNFKHELQSKNFNKSFQACLEGAVLFSTYEFSVNYLASSTTPELKRILVKEFDFDWIKLFVDKTH